MSNKYILTQAEVNALASRTGQAILSAHNHLSTINILGVPRGGISAAYLIASTSPKFSVVDNAYHADVIVDDLVDSGATLERCYKNHPSLPFYCLIDKRYDKEYAGKWLVFPWENKDGQDEGIENNIVRLIQYVGEDANREGLKETPKRVAKAWKFWTSGYSINPKDILKVFEDGAEGCDEMVVRKDIPIYSHCEHHLAAIIGKCTIAYIPDGKVVGLSKMDRLADMFARRLQVQERMTNQIADAMFDILQPKGVGVWITARHLCVESRGVCNHNSDTETSALRGVFKDQPETRAEFLAMARS